MLAVLKPFQQVGAQFLSERTRALLADEPGVGKTGQLITACNLAGARRALVVCPDIGIEHWRREFVKWEDQTTPAARETKIISWDDAHELRDHLERRGGPGKLPMQWDVIIPDEVHFGKNPQARRTKAVFAKGGLGWYARRIWAASGTPTPNNASELWPMLRAFGKTKMDLQMFTSYFCVVDHMGKIRGNRPENIAELRAILKSFSLRRLKKDVLPELEEIDVQEWYVKPSAAFIGGFGFEPALESHLRARLTGKSDDEILEFLGSDEDFSTLRRYNALLKAPAVFETLKFEIENGLLDKVVVYGYHVEAMKALHAALQKAGIASALITGETPRDARDPLIEEWKKRGTVLIASIIIASTVLDFTAAHQGIMLEFDWVPANNWQAMLRMHRHGQTNPVTVRAAMGTPIDEIVNGVCLRKMKAIAEIYS